MLLISSPAIVTIEKAVSTSIECFIEQLNSRHTAKAYRHDLAKLLGFISTVGTTMQTLTTTHAHAYVDSLSSRGLALRSLRRHISAARSFYRFLLTQGEVNRNPFADVQMPAIEQHTEPLDILSQKDIDACLLVLIEEVKLILHACMDGTSSRALRRRTFYAIRRRAIVVLLIHSDLRLSELLNLLFNSVEQTPEGFQLAITGQGSRVVYLSADCLPEFIDWLKIRNDIPTPNKHLFVGFDGAPCSRMSVRQIMKWLQARVRTKHALNPELFRRSFVHRQASMHEELASAQV